MDNTQIYDIYGFPGGSDGKESVCNVGDPLVRKIPCRKELLPTLVFLAGEFHGQKSLAGYSPLGSQSWTRLSN